MDVIRWATHKDQEIEEEQDAFNKEEVYYYTYEGEKPMSLTFRYVTSLQADIDGRMEDYTEYAAMSEALAYITMVLSIIEHKQRIKVMETAIPLFREYIRKNKRPVGRLEEIVKLSINAALNNEQRYKVIQTMGQEYKRSYCTERLARAKSDYGWGELGKVIEKEAYMIGSRVVGIEYESERERSEVEEEEDVRERSKWSLILKERIIRKEKRDRRKEKFHGTWTP
jgi:hypothetical protein